MNKPQLLLIGSITNSIAKYKDGIRERFGGGVMYGGLAAVKLGIPTTVVTIGADDIEQGMNQLKSYNLNVVRIPRDTSNNFSNDYRNNLRTLYMRSYISTPFSKKDFNQKIGCDGIILFPIFHEISPDTISAFDSKIVLLDIGGLTRELEEKNKENLYPIVQSHWKSVNGFRNKVDILKVSHEDLENIKFTPEINSDEQKVQDLADNGFPIVLFTRGEKPTILARKNEKLVEVPTYSVGKNDPAGAGEVFSVGFMCEYFMTKNPLKATAFGNACASFKISGVNYNYDMAKERAEEILK